MSVGPPVSLSDIICNSKNTAVAKSLTVNAGDKLTFEWYHDNRGDDIVADSHKGPVTVYIADAATNGVGNVWTKIAESGLEGGVWAVDTLKANGGKHSVKLPPSLAPGDYLVRAEIIALHESDTNYVTNNARGAQFYPSCAQVVVAAGGSTVPPGTFNFIGGYTPTDPGILFDLYNNPTSYPIPGPPVWTGGAADTSTKASPTKTPTSTYAAPAATTTTKTKASSTKAPTSTYVAPVATATTKTKVASPSKYPTTTYAPAVTPTTLATSTKKTATTSSTPTKKSIRTIAKKPVRTTTKKPVRTTKKPVRPTTKKPVRVTRPSCMYEAPAATPRPMTPEAINKCLDEVNACILQAQNSTGGAVNFQPCEERRASCYA